MKCLDVNPSDGASSITSSELLRAAQACDPDAWRHLVATYGRRMYRWCRISGLQPDDAANVVQESLTSVVRKLGDFRHDNPGSTFRGWLRRIVDNKICDHFRRHGRRLDTPVGGTDAYRRLTDVAWPNDCEQEAAGSTEVPPATATQSALEEILVTVRAAVGDRDWKFFWRVAVDGQSAADVGREFGVSANAVRLVKMRVLRRLRDSLGDRVLKREE